MPGRCPALSNNATLLQQLLIGKMQVKMIDEQVHVHLPVIVHNRNGIYDEDK